VHEEVNQDKTCQAEEIQYNIKTYNVPYVTQKNVIRRCGK